MDQRQPIILLLSILVLTFGQDAANTEDSGSDAESRCDDKDISDICSGCSRLSPLVRVPSETCCSDDRSFMFCDACLSNPEACEKLVSEMEDLNKPEEYYDDDDDNDAVESGDADEYYDEGLKQLLDGVSDATGGNSRVKRFGRLFMKYPKRYGRLIFGKRDSGMDTDLEKRFGRLYMGSGGYFGKRDGLSEDGNDVMKRYGPLFMNNNNNRWFGKRSGESDFDVDKRYGPLFIGKSRNGWFGKRSDVDESDDVDDVMKRYGPLFIGKGGYYGKRSGSMEKRFGRLFMGRRRNSWLG